MRLRAMIIMANPHAITSATAMAWPFIRARSRQSFRSRWEIIEFPARTRAGESNRFAQVNSLPTQSARRRSRGIGAHIMHASIGDLHYAVGDFCHYRVVSDHNG